MSDSRSIIRRLEKDGWVLVRVKGSHHRYEHPDREDKITVVHPKRDLTPGVLNDIMKKAGWK